MSAPRLSALKPWTHAWAGPLALSVAVHAAIVALALGLGGLFEPPRPDPVIPVELVFASAPSARSTVAAQANPASDHPPSPQPPSSFPRKRESSDPGSPLSRGRRDKCADTSGSCPKPAEPSPRDVAAIAKAPAPAVPVAKTLPDHAPLPPVRVSARVPAHATLTAAQSRAADDAITRMLDAAAAKAATVPPITNASVSPPTLSLPHKGGGNPRREPFVSSFSPLTSEEQDGGQKTPSRPATQQAARIGAADALVPPAWGRPGLGNAPPVYPLAARRSGAEGRVVLRVRVSADGNVASVTVATSSGHELLDQAARHAVAGWRFVPGRLAGIPVAASVDVPVVFRLKD